MPDRFADGRHQSIERGLARAGYRVVRAGPDALPGGDADVLVTWTRHQGHKETHARRFEAAGGRVVVCEEAYLRKIRGRQYFALSLHDHNGAGWTPDGDPSRWYSFGIDLTDWRAPGEQLLVREQRGIGSSLMASPAGWHTNMAAELRAIGWPVAVRRHPKYRPADAAGADGPLEHALAGCQAVVTWASAIAGKALIAGVPVFVCAPHSIVAAACNRELSAERLAAPRRPDRLAALTRLAWGQWAVDEIESGAAFDHLLSEPR